jgi:hypothetical protein
MANLRGLTIKTGVNMSPMQTANIAKAAMSSPPKTSNRSHRLTANIGQPVSALLIGKLENAGLLHARQFCAGTPFTHIGHRAQPAQSAGDQMTCSGFGRLKPHETMHAIRKDSIYRNFV